MLPDFHAPLLDGFEGNFAVLADQFTIHEKAVTHRPDCCDMSHVAIDWVERPRKEITGSRGGNITIPFQPKEVRVEVDHSRVGGGLSDMMVQDQRQIPSFIQIG